MPSNIIFIGKSCKHKRETSPIIKNRNPTRNQQVKVLFYDAWFCTVVGMFKFCPKFICCSRYLDEQSSMWYSGMMGRQYDRPVIWWSNVYFDRIGIIVWDLALGHFKLFFTELFWKKIHFFTQFLAKFPFKLFIIIIFFIIFLQLKKKI